MKSEERIHSLEELVSINLLRLDKMDEQIDKMDEQIKVDKIWTKIGWIMAGSSLLVAALALYSVFNFHLLTQ
ncbi:MAG: hypothetical protein L3J06_03625 [Cyclobacteriaceae bacterium]|nr:hypothetical protein [Cyclobacteriaceae bacterium]